MNNVKRGSVWTLKNTHTLNKNIIGVIVVEKDDIDVQSETTTVIPIFNKDKTYSLLENLNQERLFENYIIKINGLNKLLKSDLDKNIGELTQDNINQLDKLLADFIMKA